MSKNAENIALGVAGVVLAYALYRHFMPGGAQAASQPFKAASSIAPVDGAGYDRNNPGQFIPLSMYIPGVIEDFNNGTMETEFTIGGLMKSVLSESYGTGQKSVVRAPGGYW